MFRTLKRLITGTGGLAAAAAGPDLADGSWALVPAVQAANSRRSFQRSGGALTPTRPAPAPAAELEHLHLLTSEEREIVRRQRSKTPPPLPPDARGGQQVANPEPSTGGSPDRPREAATSESPLAELIARHGDQLSEQERRVLAAQLVGPAQDRPATPPRPGTGDGSDGGEGSLRRCAADSGSRQTTDSAAVVAAWFVLGDQIEERLADTDTVTDQIALQQELEDTAAELAPEDIQRYGLQK